MRVSKGDLLLFNWKRSSQRGQMKSLAGVLGLNDSSHGEGQLGQKRLASAQDSVATRARCEGLL